MDPSTGALGDLNTAIQHYEDELNSAPDDCIEQACRLENLGRGYEERYLKFGSATDLELAFEQFHKALEITPKNYPGREFQLQNLGLKYQKKYHTTGEQSDIELALNYYEEALQTTASVFGQRASHLADLGSAYFDRYDMARAETDLERAIRLFEDAFETTPWDHLERAARFRDLGQVYSSRYERLGDLADLELANMKYEAAVETTPKDHPELARRLRDVARGYHDLYRRTGFGDELELAIERYEEALKITPRDHPERANRLQSLGVGYLDRYYDQGMQADLELAIEQFEQALKSTPSDHPERSARFHGLGIGYYRRYQRTGSQVNLKLAIQQHEEALNHSPSPIFQRLGCITDLLSLHAEAKNWSLAYQAASTAMSLIALLTPLSLQNSDKQYLLSQFSGLGTFAAAIALNAKASPFEAIRLLELGRGVIIGSLNNMRFDVADLQFEHPKVAEEYIKLRDRLSTSTRQVDLDTPSEVTPLVNQRYHAALKFKRTVQIIRGLPGFDRFLISPFEDELKAACTMGPIVIINVSNYRCDALIIKKHELKSIPLPDLSNSDIQARTMAVMSPDSLDTQLLEWLWDTIAKPVLDAMGFTKRPEGRLPRIWWIPTGPLAKFPIHAAGYHSSDSDTVLDRVISSYSSSVSALVHGRQKHSTLSVERRPGKAVLVGMGQTPGQKDLPFVPLEIDKLQRLCSSLQLQVCKPLPCREDVLAALNDCDIFHFAGHGETDPKDPSKSSFILRDGPLAVADLFETNLHNRKPFLAYLSACGTGQVKNDGLIDEALHLIAAYRIIGFRHVIGTLWEVNDKSCVEVATTIYKWMQERNMTDDSVSEGLHRASIKLRESWISDNAARAANRMAALQDKDGPMMTEQACSSQSTVGDPRTAELYEDTPLYWVPYVHFGI